MALLLDGKSAAAQGKESLRTRIAALAQAPKLVVIQVAGDPAADRYVKAIGRSCADVGAGYELIGLPADADTAQVVAEVQRASADVGVQGIIIQMPLPRHIDATAVVAALDPRKDIDGIHPTNAGQLAIGRPTLVPATPSGGMALLRHYEIPVAGKHAVVIGRSAVVGRPMALLLLQADATVTVCHSRTVDLPALVRQADIVVAAIGKARFVTRDMVKAGAVVIDFGINVADDGTLCGDVDSAPLTDVVSAYTPVPGGTGPMTKVMLLENLLTAAGR